MLQVVVLTVAVSLISEIYKRAQSFSSRLDRSGVVYRSLQSDGDEEEQELNQSVDEGGLGPNGGH